MTITQGRQNFLKGAGGRDSLFSILKSVGPLGWVKVAFFALLLTMIYLSSLRQLVLSDWQNEDYSYCILVPFLVLYLLYERRNEFVSGPSALNWIGLAPLGAGVALFWAGEFAGAYFFQHISLWCVILGLVWVHFGWRNIKIAWVALLVLLAAFPLPSFLNLKVSFILKLISSQLGVSLLQLCGMSAYREGNVIDLGFTQLQVVDACSGLRYVFPLMVLSFVLAYWSRDHWWKRSVLFLSSIPVAIVVNSIRIAATGILYSWLGPAVAEGFFHGFSGWLIFIITLPWLLLEMYILKKLPPRGSRTDSRPGATTLEDDGQTPRKTLGNGPAQVVKPSVKQRRIVLSVIAAILILTSALPRFLDFRENIPSRKSLSNFPVQIGEFTGSREVMERNFLDVLKLSDYALIGYRDSQRKEVNFYVAYYESQLKGEGIHLPDSCLPAGGWYFSETGTWDISLNDGKMLRVNRILMEKGGTRELSYYWFPQRGRAFSSVWELRIYNFWDTLTRRRSDGALLRLITPVYAGEGVEQAERRLRSFVSQIDPIIAEYVPD